MKNLEEMLVAFFLKHPVYNWNYVDDHSDDYDDYDYARASKTKSGISKIRVGPKKDFMCPS